MRQPYGKRLWLQSDDEADGIMAVMSRLRSIMPSHKSRVGLRQHLGRVLPQALLAVFRLVVLITRTGTPGGLPQRSSAGTPGGLPAGSTDNR